MKTVSIAFAFVAAAAALTAETNPYVGSGHVDTTQLSLLAKDIKPEAPPPRVYALPRTTDITLPRAAFVADKTDLIGTVSDQRRLLRSLRIDPAPQPPSQSETPPKATARSLGNASQKH